MSDLDSKLTTALEEVASHGRNRAIPAAAFEVRRTADHRGRRRKVVIAAASGLAVVVALGVVVGDGHVSREKAASDPATSTTKNIPELGPSLLISLEDVVRTVSKVGNEPWREGESGNGPQRISLCQNSGYAEEDGVAAWTRDFSSGETFGVNTVNQLVLQPADEATARATFQRAVSWFTECSQAEGAEAWPDATGPAVRNGMDEMKRLLEQLAPIAGLDEVQTIVRSDGKDDPTYELAGIMRIGSRVSVIVWDDGPPHGGNGEPNPGFVELVRIAASKLAGVDSPAVPEAAMLQVEDEAVKALAQKPAREVYLKYDPYEGQICYYPTPAQVPPGFVTGYFNDFLVSYPPFLRQGVWVFSSPVAAEEWMRHTHPAQSTCSADHPAGTRKDLRFSGGDEAWAMSYSESYRTDEGGGEAIHYYAAARVGRAVVTVGLDTATPNELAIKVTEEKALEVFRAAAERLEAVYG